MPGETVHDDMLLSMLRDCKTLPVFLDHVFGFLKRRTDFYVVSNEAHSKLGLPPGLAQSLIKQTYLHYAEETSYSQQNILKNCSSDSKLVRPLTQLNTQSDPSKSYNGASFDNYSWSQSYNEVDLYLKLPEKSPSRKIIVTTTTNTICIKLKNGEVLLQGELFQKCKTDPVWSIESNELLLHFEKCKEIWWNCFLTREPKLDMNKIDCSKPIEDLPEDAQAKIQELQWNQEQKRLGLPTSDHIKTLKTLNRAWNAEGSPFTGSFDPSTISLE